MASSYIIYEVIPPNPGPFEINNQINPSFPGGPSYGVAGINNSYSIGNPNFNINSNPLVQVQTGYNSSSNSIYFKIKQYIDVYINRYNSYKQLPFYSNITLVLNGGPGFNIYSLENLITFINNNPLGLPDFFFTIEQLKFLGVILPSSSYSGNFSKPPVFNFLQLPPGIYNDGNYFDSINNQYNNYETANGNNSNGNISFFFYYLQLDLVFNNNNSVSSNSLTSRINPNNFIISYEDGIETLKTQSNIETNQIHQK
jgi:hypothetical protein